MSTHGNESTQILAALAELKAQHVSMGRELGEMKADIRDLELRQRKSEEAMSRLQGKIVGYGGAAVVVLGVLEVLILLYK